ncbi:MAG: LptF/LptG family permease [Terrimicrobiaceae bacterium]
MSILDRYVLKKFLVPFAYCFFGFVGIWFIFDLADNLQDFIQGQASFEVLLGYYASQVPEIIVIALPLGTLLALLYSLSAMSRANEIISMLGAGRSVVRILVPLMAVGVVLSGVNAYFNYESAPQATGMKKTVVGDIKRGRKKERAISGHLFKNREDHRVWFVSRLNLDKGTLDDVQIVQQDENGHIRGQWYASSASFDPSTATWHLKHARQVEMEPNGDIVKTEMKENLTIEGFSETPWRVASSRMNADYLSVPELRDYLKYNSDFPEKRLAAYRTHLHYRWALPTVCFLVVFVAAPCGIVYSRRGVLGGVALAITLFFGLVLASSLFIALGKGSRVTPFVAAWGPMIAFFAAGIYLLWMRSTNRDLPKLRIPGIS